MTSRRDPWINETSIQDTLAQWLRKKKKGSLSRREREKRWWFISMIEDNWRSRKRGEERMMCESVCCRLLLASFSSRDWKTVTVIVLLLTRQQEKYSEAALMKRKARICMLKSCLAFFFVCVVMSSFFCCSLFKFVWCLELEEKSSNLKNNMWGDCSCAFESLDSVSEAASEGVWEAVSEAVRVSASLVMNDRRNAKRNDRRNERIRWRSIILNASSKWCIRINYFGCNQIALLFSFSFSSLLVQSCSLFAENASWKVVVVHNLKANWIKPIIPNQGWCFLMTMHENKKKTLRRMTGIIKGK